VGGAPFSFELTYARDAPWTDAFVVRAYARSFLCVLEAHKLLCGKAQ